MRTLIIEKDEQTISKLEISLEEIGITTLIGKYTSPKEVESGILSLRPNLIILGLDSLQQDGIRFAQKIEQKLQDVKFLFITSNATYALEAFELNQADFILKPLKRKRLEKSMRKLADRTLKIESEVTHILCCFKDLHSIKYEGENELKETNLKWRTKSAKEIFTYLITHKNINIRKDVLIDAIWPEIDVKDAYNNLYTNIYLIRQTIEEANLPIIINNEDDYYNISLNGMKVDFDLWLEKIKQYKFTCLTKLEKVMSFYKGHFLQEENYLWLSYTQDEYRLIWLETIDYMIQEYIKRDEIYKAIKHALYFQKLEPYLEKTYCILIDLFAHIRDFGSVERQYRKLEKMLQEEYGIKPTKELKCYLES